MARTGRVRQTQRAGLGCGPLLPASGADRAPARGRRAPERACGCGRLGERAGLARGPPASELRARPAGGECEAGPAGLPEPVEVWAGRRGRGLTQPGTPTSRCEPGRRFPPPGPREPAGGAASHHAPRLGLSVRLPPGVGAGRGRAGLGRLHGASGRVARGSGLGCSSPTLRTPSGREWPGARPCLRRGGDPTVVGVGAHRPGRTQSPAASRA